ncbi:MAG: DUF192 domain-containing protein [Candidatus Pacebacteria bacterium]|nr:DUF192 domain-containing protein [Candidatus Paceibacterota bacterium]
MPDSFKILLVVLIGGSLVILLWQYKSAASITEEPLTKTATTTPRSYFAPLVPWTIGGQAVFASIATTDETRALGLSNTTALPTDIVKLFVFATDERWSFWMKDMAYSIDIIWVTATGTVVHIEKGVSPATYPDSFSPSVPARYVIETVPGLAESVRLEVGDVLDMTPVIEKNP